MRCASTTSPLGQMLPYPPVFFPGSTARALAPTKLLSLLLIWFPVVYAVNKWESGSDLKCTRTYSGRGSRTTSWPWKTIACWGIVTRVVMLRKAHGWHVYVYVRVYLYRRYKQVIEYLISSGNNYVYRVSILPECLRIFWWILVL